MLLLNLRNVPEDEAEQVKELLTENEIPFFETSPSFFGFNAGGIWLQQKEHGPEAKALLADYQQQRAEAAQAHWQELRERGIQPTQWQMMKKHPIRFAFTLIGIVILFVIMLLPFLSGFA